MLVLLLLSCLLCATYVYFGYKQVFDTMSGFLELAALWLAAPGLVRPCRIPAVPCADIRDSSLASYVSLFAGERTQ